MRTIYDLFPQKNGFYADELYYNVGTGCYYILYFEFDDDGIGEFVELRVTRQDIREAKKAYDNETEAVKKRIAFIKSIHNNCRTFLVEEDDDDYFSEYVHAYLRNVLTAATFTSSISEVMILFGLSTDENYLDLDEADKFIRILTLEIEKGD